MVQMMRKACHEPRDVQLDLKRGVWRCGTQPVPRLQPQFLLPHFGKPLARTRGQPTNTWGGKHGHGIVDIKLSEDFRVLVRRLAKKLSTEMFSQALQLPELSQARHEPQP